MLFNNYFQLSLTIPCDLEPELFVGFYLLLFLFIPLIIFIGWMVHVHFIKFPFHLVLGAPPPIFAISGNILIWFLDTSGFNIVKSLNINLVGVPSFSVGEVQGSVKSSCLNFCKDRSLFFSILDRQGVSASILASLVSVSDHSVAATILLYF